MTDDVIRFRKPRVEQLSKQDLNGLTSEEIDAARRGGHLADLMHGVKPAPIPPAPTSDPVKDLAREIANKARP